MRPWTLVLPSLLLFISVICSEVYEGSGEAIALYEGSGDTIYDPYPDPEPFPVDPLYYSDNDLQYPDYNYDNYGGFYADPYYDYPYVDGPFAALEPDTDPFLMRLKRDIPDEVWAAHEAGDAIPDNELDKPEIKAKQDKVMLMAEFIEEYNLEDDYLDDYPE